MMQKIQEYNKAVYGGLAVAVTQIIVYALSMYGVDLPAEVSAAITTVVAVIIIVGSPKNAEPPKPEARPDDQPTG